MKALTFSSGAFVSTNTGVINVGWITNPPNLTPVMILTEQYVSNFGTSLEYALLESIQKLDETYDYLVSQAIQATDLTYMDSTNIDTYVQIVYNNYLLVASGNLGLSLINPKVNNLSSEAETTINNGISEVYSISSQNNLDNIINTMDLTGMDSTNIDTHTDIIYNNISTEG